MKLLIISQIYIHRNIDDLKSKSGDFLYKQQITNTIEIPDGKHIEINHLLNVGSMYYKYKSYNSISYYNFLL